MTGCTGEYILVNRLGSDQFSSMMGGPKSRDVDDCTIGLLTGCERSRRRKHPESINPESDISVPASSMFTINDIFCTKTRRMNYIP